MLGFSMNPTCATTRTMPSHTGVTVKRLDAGDARLLAGHHRQQHHPLVHHAVELDVVEQRARDARRLRIQENRRARHPHRRIALQVLEEIAHRLLLAQQARHDRGTAALPGLHQPDR